MADIRWRPDRLRLRPFQSEDEPEVRLAHAVMARDSFEFAQGLSHECTWSSYLRRLRDVEAGIGLAPGRVPTTLLLADVAGVIVGRASIRHCLTDWLLEHAGHIGYGVLPAYRRQGFATEILRQSITNARALGIERVLVVCDDDNTGSATIIERCGGYLDPHHPVSTGDRPGRRYWIAR